ncbi:ras-related protein Rab-32 isoform X1 [Diabrotica undecimpunctata]|uniref:ras-related protein Rab-32 isoform X1 n=1 Tax=Diabrotica undecimpunctata TaxID=50387 RepID=UPI003B633603
MKSDTENESTQNRGKEERSRRSKRIPIPLSPRVKQRMLILSKRFKSRNKITTRREIRELAKVPLPSTSSDERHTPDRDNFFLTRSVSDTDLSWQSADNLTKASARSHSVGYQSALERTKSLEDFTDMTAYGELIMDQPPNTSNANQSTSKPKDHLYKILVIGDLGTGKTSIIKRYVHRFFTQHYRATIGVDFALKVLNWDENTLIRLQLWDIAGQERYGNMTRVYYKEAVGAFIVFDVTRKPTFESVANWKADLDSKVQLPDGSKIPCVLLANKCDQQKEGIASSPSKMEEYCRENGFHAWYETSAKDNINIDEAARSLVEKILAYDSVLNSDSKRSSDQFSLRRDSDGNSANRRSCSC